MIKRNSFNSFSTLTGDKMYSFILTQLAAIQWQWGNKIFCNNNYNSSVIKLIIRAFSGRDYSSGRERIKVWWILMNQIRRLRLFNDNVWRWWTAASLEELGAFTAFPILFSCKASHSDPRISLNPESDQGSVWPEAFSLLQSSSELLRYSCCVVAHLWASLNKKCRVGCFFFY